MGTNFYATLPNGETFHIGKRSGAGGGLCSWSLQGIRKGCGACGRDYDSFREPILTWADWKVQLLKDGTVVKDEYGREHAVQDFIAEVESTTVENRRRQYDWMVKHEYEGTWRIHHIVPEGEKPDPDEPWNSGEWLCPDGFSFTFSDFS